MTSDAVRDHASPRADLAQTLHLVAMLLHAVLAGKRAGFNGDTATLSGRVDCYGNAQLAIKEVDLLLVDGLGGKPVRWGDEHPKNEAEMKRAAKKSLETVRLLERRYRVDAASGTAL